MATGMDKVKELFTDGALLAFSGDTDKIATEIDNAEIILNCGSALDCLPYPRPSYATGNAVEKTLNDAYLWLGNSSLKEWHDKASDADKEIIKAACPDFYKAACNAVKYETGPFMPCAVIGDVENTADNLNKAINAMDAAWQENADAENGERGEAAADAMQGVYDNMLYNAADVQFSCQLRLQVVDCDKDGTLVNFDAGLPLNDVWTRLFSVVIPFYASEPEIKEIIRDAAFTADYSELLAY